MSNFLGDGSADVSQEEDEGRALSSERRRRMINVFIIAPGLLSASFLISLNLKSNYYLGFIPFPQKVMLLLGFVLFLLFLGCLTLYYLQNGISFSSETRSLVSEAMGLSYKVLGLNDEGPRSDRLDSLENTVSELKNKLAGLSLGDYKELVDDEVAKIKASVDSEVWGEILKSLPKKTDQENKLLAIEREFAQSRFRLMKEVSALGLRGNVNLTLGFLTTVTGLGVLSYFIWVSAGVSQDLVSFVISFVPRLSLVIFIQVFAFFFSCVFTSLGYLKLNIFKMKLLTWS